MPYKLSAPLKLVFLAGCLVVALGAAYYVTGKPSGIDLLAGQDWSHFAGAETTDSGIRIKPLGRVITHKDTSMGQVNPPVNVRGPHLRVSGDFQVEAKMAGIDNGAAFQFYGQVPIIYDEWRQERGSIRVDISGNTLKARIRDGSSSSSIDERTFKIPVKKSGTLTLRHKNDQIIILFDGRRLGFLPDHGIFAHGTVWFGADAALGGGWTLTSLRARSLDKRNIEIAPPPELTVTHNQPDTLRNLAAGKTRKLSIGAAVSLYPLLTDDQYRSIALSQFSMITPENEFKPQSIHPQKNTYSFTDTDSLVEIAQKNQMLIHGHSLVMPKANPLWMEKTPENERKQIMIEHINTVVGRYKGKVAAWDVVNEPMSEESVDYTNQNLGLRPQMWLDAMGEEYIDTAFRAARGADPAAKLYLNDFGLAEDNMRWDGLINLIKRLQARGVPIDGVGFESHVYHAKDSINPQILRRHIRQLAGLGIVSRISEIDILGDDPALQAKQYADVLEVCLSEPTCVSYGTWGITDLYGSTTLSDRYPPLLGDSLLWDQDMKPKPAYSALQEILKTAP